MTLEIFLFAMMMLESGGRDVIGDQGRSIGPYQIQYAYWKDSGVPGRYAMCHNREYAKKVVLAYMRRYEPTAFKNRDWKTLAKLHNGGPGWRIGKKRQAATEKYWNKINALMKRYSKRK